jgi:hypothetical protein
VGLVVVAALVCSTTFDFGGSGVGATALVLVARFGVLIAVAVGSLVTFRSRHSHVAAVKA